MRKKNMLMMPPSFTCAEGGKKSANVYDINFYTICAFIIIGFFVSILIRTSMRDRMMPRQQGEILKVPFFGKVSQQYPWQVFFVPISFQTCGFVSLVVNGTLLLHSEKATIPLDSVYGLMHTPQHINMNAYCLHTAPRVQLQDQNAAERRLGGLPAHPAPEPAWRPQRVHHRPHQLQLERRPHVCIGAASSTWSNRK